MIGNQMPKSTQEDKKQKWRVWIFKMENIWNLPEESTSDIFNLFCFVLHKSHLGRLGRMGIKGADSQNLDA